MVTIKGDGAACAGCCAAEAGAGWGTGLLAAFTPKDSDKEVARIAKAKIFKGLLHSAETKFRS